MSGEFVTKDSGHRREFQTGARRDRAIGKGRYDLIPPMLLERYAKVLERGAIKYGPNNWQKGMPLSCFIDSALRHVAQLAAGDRDEDHAFQAIFNLVGYEWTRQEIIEGRLPVALADHPGDPVSELLTAIDQEAGEVDPLADL